MQYWVRMFGTISILAYFIIYGVAYAQIVSFGDQSKPMLSQLNKSMSPADFKNKVKSLGQKNRDELSKQFKQEVDQQLKSQPQAQTPPPPTPGEESTVITGTPTNVTPTFSPSSPGASPPATATFDSQPTTPGQSQTYTGFGQGTGGSAPAKSTTPGGWNVKY